jgi:putative membrane-bound dehydrogenase-like protein
MSLTEEQKRLHQYSLNSMQLANGLEASPFAHEPMLVNPTNIDVDHRGRVWVCEGFNYRLPLNPDKEAKPDGDRILILEDTDLDGVADKQTVFYQGHDVNAALGITVLGNKVIVSKSPDIFVLTDTDGDDQADSKEILFTGMGGIEHDHGIHAVMFGPDGKLYFNAGNDMHQMMRPDSSLVVDQAGNTVDDSGNPYRQGMAFRCNIDGSALETIGWNFRNPYELAVDSYGNIWQSDNDDDGNRGTRLNFVMEFGNYGYTDEMTGAGWRTKRTGMAEDIPLRHWHLNDPGVVPNLLQLYAGSPTGILFYEGSLLPEIYHGTMIHCEAGSNVVRSYPVRKQGAGYQAELLEIMKATDDPWFRPSDVCVAPDGSLFISDWYDPGVGGHLVGDQQKGRIFRIAPENIKYTIPEYDFETTEGLIEALKSPNQATRYLAWTGLQQLGQAAKPALMALFEGPDPVHSARALWLLAEINAEEAFELGSTSDNEDLQIVAIRIARQKLQPKLVEKLQQFSTSLSPQIHRELALALRFENGSDAVELWTAVARQYQGDRWLLEALGIGSDLNADACFAAWINAVGEDWNKDTNQDIVWRLRSEAALPYLSQLILESQNIEDTYRYFRAFDFHRSPEKNSTIESLLSKIEIDRDAYLKIAFSHLDQDYVLKSPALKQELFAVVDSYRGTEDFLLTIQRYSLQQYNQELLDMILQANENGRQATRMLLSNEPKLIGQVLNNRDEQQNSIMLAALGSVGSSQSLEMLETYMLDSQNPVALRQQAAQYYATSWLGQNQILKLLEDPDFPEALKKPAAGSLASSWRPAMRKEAAKYLDLPETNTTLPGINELVLMEGDAASGAQVFEKVCQSCHVVNGQGTDFGPALSEIGSKLSKEALYISILQPDAGVSFGYEGYLVTLKDGTKITGLIQSRTESEITLKQIGETSTVYAMNQVSTIEQLTNSMMTPNLHTLMEQQELIDLISYLEELDNPV